MSGLRGVGGILENFMNLSSHASEEVSLEAVDWEPDLYEKFQTVQLQRWMNDYNRRNGPGRYSGLGDD